MQIYEFAVLLNEKRDKDGEVTEPAEIVVDVTRVLARDEAQAQDAGGPRDPRRRLSATAVSIVS